MGIVDESDGEACFSCWLSKIEYLFREIKKNEINNY